MESFEHATTIAAPARAEQPVPQAFAEEWEHMQTIIDGARESELYFYFRSLESGVEPRIRSRGRDMLLLAGNNYLGLATHPLMRARAIAAIEEYGTGLPGNQLLNSHTPLHQRLEESVARFKGKEDAILFPSGYQCNVGTIAALVGDGDLVVSDKLNHASILDGCKLSGADLRTFAHNKMRKLGEILERSGRYRKRLIVVDGVYSMDGDLADLPAICDLAERYEAIVMVDEAHATGVLGPTGRGTVEHFDVTDRVHVVMGTLSKALACLGGFVAGSRALVEYLRHSARGFIFSTALPPAVAAGALTAIELVDAEPWRRERVWANTARFRDGLRAIGFDTGRSVTPIIPIMVRDTYQVSEMAQVLDRMGVFVCAFFPPAVPPNRSRLRVHMTAVHTAADVDEGLECFARAGREVGVLG